MSLCITTMSLFDYGGTDKSKKWEGIAFMRKTRHLMKLELHCSPKENSSAKQRFLGKNALKDIPR